jgi:hypothetical protein
MCGGRRWVPRLRLIWLVTALMALACGTQAQFDPTPTPTPLASPSATVTLVATAAPSATAITTHVPQRATATSANTPTERATVLATSPPSGSPDLAPTRFAPGGPTERATAATVAATATISLPTPTSAPPTPTPEPPTPTPEPCPGAIPWDQALDHVGEYVTVIGPVAGATYASESRGKPTFINLGLPYPEPGRFTILIWIENRWAFPTPPEEAYTGLIICVSGFVDIYDGVAEMEIIGPDQIFIP